jgi:hypothetical protein
MAHFRFGFTVPAMTSLTGAAGEFPRFSRHLVIAWRSGLNRRKRQRLAVVRRRRRKPRDETRRMKRNGHRKRLKMHCRLRRRMQFRRRLKALHLPRRMRTGEAAEAV